MMYCTEYRRLLLTEPGPPRGQMRAHMAQCDDCARYTDRVLRAEGRLQRALQVDIGSPADPVSGFLPFRGAAFGTGATWRSRRSGLGRRGLAIAASLLVATLGAVFLWVAAPGRSLAAAVVSHMAGEPGAWRRTGIAVPERTLDAVMSESGAHLRLSAGLVSYVHSCEFRGHRVPHLVVQTAAGPVTVMVLEHETVRSRLHFDEQGYRGMIVPVPHHGSLAVLEHAAGADAKTIDAVAGQVLAALDWNGSGTASGR